MCCDETAVRQLGERSRAVYAAVLLRLSAVARASAGPTLCFGVGSVKARLQNLCRQKRPGGWAVTGGAAVCLVLALCLLLGTLRLHPLGTTDAAVLQAVRTGESALPMPVFSSVALANHTGYTDYRVRCAWDTGAAATAQYVRQTLTDDGAAAEAYWQETDCVLAYDWTVLPYFAELLTEPGAFTSAEQAAIAQSMQFSIA